jgi:hypothetical protein
VLHLPASLNQSIIMLQGLHPCQEAATIPVTQGSSDDSNLTQAACLVKPLIMVMYYIQAL